MQLDEQYMGIGEAARRVGCSIDTLRNFERRGLIAVPRTWAGVRRFGPKELTALRALIALPPEQRRKKAQRA